MIILAMIIQEYYQQPSQPPVGSKLVSSQRDCSVVATTSTTAVKYGLYMQNFCIIACSFFNPLLFFLNCCQSWHGQLTYYVMDFVQNLSLRLSYIFRSIKYSNSIRISRFHDNIPLLVSIKRTTQLHKWSKQVLFQPCNHFLVLFKRGANLCCLLRVFKHFVIYCPAFINSFMGSEPRKYLVILFLTKFLF